MSDRESRVLRLRAMMLIRFRVIGLWQVEIIRLGVSDALGGLRGLSMCVHMGLAMVACCSVGSTDLRSYMDGR